MKRLIQMFNVADVLQIGGASAIGVGCFLIAPALGFIVSGFFMLLFGIALGARKDN